MRRPSLLTPLLALSVSCSGGAKENPAESPAEAQPAPRAEVKFETMPEDQIGLKMTFRDARPLDATAGLPRPATAPLSKEDAEKLLSRVPAMSDLPEDRQPFALRKGPIPPPLTGESVNLSFPPPPEGPAPEVASGPLTVLRYAPEGAVPMVPNLSVTFSQPMVAVTSQEEAAKTVPLSISPQPKGRWRWLGTKTIIFDPDPVTDDASVTGRFPMATQYKVTIPAGTKSAIGGSMEKELSFTFETPPVSVRQSWPSDYQPQKRDPIIFLSFDQAIDSAVVAARLQLTAGGKTYPVRTATNAEIAEDPVVKNLVKAERANRWIAVKPVEPLPVRTTFAVKMPKGTPSSEGPLTQTSDYNTSFYTYAPLEITRHQCSWGDVDCPPTAPWSIELNNPMDPKAFDPSTWKVTPAVPGLMVQGGNGNWITISGQFTGRTTYTVTVPGTLKDQFGQTLGKDQVLTFKVGPAEKTLSGPSNLITVLDPSARGQVSVHSTNHKALKVRLYAVEPDQYGAWVKWMQRWQYDDATPGTPPGKKVRDDVVKVEGEADRMAETVIDLKSYLKEGHGQFILAVEPTVQPKDRWARQYVFSWLQQTDIGLTAFSDNKDLVGWASDLATGAPVDGVELYLLGPEGKKAFSGKDGLASLALPTKAWSEEAPQVLVARKGSDVAILPENAYSYWYGGGDSWVASERLVGLRWYVFDDRGLYKPGEQARVKGWLRRYDPNKGGDVRGLDVGPTKLSWRLTDPVGNEIGKGEAKVSGLGGFDFPVDIPKDVNLGYASLQITAMDASGVVDTTTTHALNIQEFRRPEFEVSTSVRNDKPHVLGEDVFASVTASYFAGGGLANADVTWVAYASPTSFTPPNRDEWSFGTWSPWWWYGGGAPGGNTPAASWKGKTDPSGEHPVAIHLDALNPAKAMSVHVESTVFDVNRQAWTSGGDFVVHPADVYVGLKTARSFVEKGQPIEVESLVVDLDGKTVSDLQVDLAIARKEYGWKDGQYRESDEDPKSCQVKSAADAQKCTFKYDVGGSYAITATIKDSHGRKNVTELRVWVEGADTVPARDVQMEQVLLIPEKDTFQPGDTARFLVQAPFYPAEGTLTVRRSGLVTSRRFRMETATMALEVPITDDLIPNVRVQVDLVGQAVRVDDHGKKQPDLPKRTAFASGGLDLKVPPLKRTLKVQVEPSARMVSPAGASDLVLTVLDADGKPVPNAEVAVIVADESVLSLTGYKIPDPIELFYAARDPGVQDRHLRAQVLLANPVGLPVSGQGDAGGFGSLGMSGEGRGGGGIADGLMAGAPMPDVAAAAPMEPMKTESSAEKDNESKAAPRAKQRASVDKVDKPSVNQPTTPQIAMRTDFSALALFAPEVRTDAMGRAIVPLKLPDSLTRYRVMVVAVAGDKQFGMGESNVTARLPLMVRPSAPRFLNFGDQVELPIVLQNQTDEAMLVDVALRGSNVTFIDKLGATVAAPDALTSVAGLKVTVPANDRVEVRFPAATSMAGTARFQAVAASGTGQDASTFELPVWTPATTEAFATYGDIAKGGAVQPIQVPPNVWPQFGGLEVTTSSTQLQALTDAVLYLTRYPYDCNEQIASRILAIAALRDVLDAFHSEELPPAEVLRKSVDDDMARLERRQNWNGGWSFWRKGDEDWPYLTIHVAESLAQAKAKGYAVPDPMWTRTLQYLRTIESHIPWWYSQESKWSLRAFALDARERMGDPDVGEAKRLYKEAGLKGLQLDGQAWILPTLAKGKANAETQAILKNLANNSTETAGNAHFVTSYSDGEYVLLNSDRRADGIILDALLRVDAKNDLIPKVVRGLLANRTRGHWENTQENAYVLLAMDRYFHEYEKETPDFVARVWLGDGYAGDHTFKGRTTERAQIDVPMAYLTEQKGQVPLTIQRDGDSGRLYYRVGMRYAPTDLNLKALDDGFAVTRLYEGIDDPKDVTRDSEGTWHIVAGSRVRVRLSMVAPSRRYHVALVDPLPAGLEVVNPDLATSGTLPSDPNSQSGGGKYWWWSRTWYEHENMRDDRVEAFASLVWDGVHEYTYVARATTPGRFVVPPTKAEEMYSPETFGRASSDRVIIE